MTNKLALVTKATYTKTQKPKPTGSKSRACWFLKPRLHQIHVTRYKYMYHRLKQLKSVYMSTDTIDGYKF